MKTDPRRAGWLTLALLTVACSPGEIVPDPVASAPPAAEEEPATIEYYISSETFNAGYPFADAVRVGDLMMLSGQIGVDPATFELVEGGIEAETRRALDNVGRILDARNLSFEDLVKCTVMLADIADWPAFNEIYRSYFPTGDYPARSAFAAAGLALGARVEVECWAAVP